MTNCVTAPLLRQTARSGTNFKTQNLMNLAVPNQTPLIVVAVQNATPTDFHQTRLEQIFSLIQMLSLLAFGLQVRSLWSNERLRKTDHPSFPAVAVQD